MIQFVTLNNLVPRLTRKPEAYEEKIKSLFDLMPNMFLMFFFPPDTYNNINDLSCNKHWDILRQKKVHRRRFGQVCFLKETQLRVPARSWTTHCCRTDPAALQFCSTCLLRLLFTTRTRFYISSITDTVNAAKCQTETRIPVGFDMEMCAYLH